MMAMEGFVMWCVDGCGVRLHVPGLARAQDRGVRLGGVLHLLARGSGQLGGHADWWTSHMAATSWCMSGFFR